MRVAKCLRWSRYMKTWMKIWGCGLVLVLSCLGTACDEGETYVAPDACGQGQQLSLEGTHCLFDSTLIIEGFLCPEEQPHRTDYEEFAVCSSEEELPEDFDEALQSQGFEPDPLEGDSGQSCEREGAQIAADDGCNTCTCDNGSWSCTEIACGGNNSDNSDNNGLPETCVPGDTGMQDCNTCTCTDAGLWICTEIACSNNSNPGNNAMCTDGQVMEFECYTCTCENGEWDCPPELPCPPDDNNVQPSEGDLLCAEGGSGTFVSDDGCNQCGCGETGQGVGCTEAGCEQQCEDGDTFEAENNCNCECQGGFWSCNPQGCMTNACVEGAVLPAGDNCNTCTCFDGVWACTRLACE